MSNSVKTFNFSGIKKISIPIRKKQITVENIVKFLPRIKEEHDKNSTKIKYFQDIYEGRQDIISKTRPYADDADNNNKIVENHAYSQVGFKVSSIVGEPIQYTQKESLKTDDLTYLIRYNSDIFKPEVDNETITNVYVCGVGYELTLPRYDDYDIEHESPYNIMSCDPANTCIVYSSFLSEGELFGIMFNTYLDINNKTIIEAKVYTSDYFYTFDLTQSNNIKLIDSEKNSLKQICLVEFARNKSRIGIIELCYYLYHAINLISSSSMDNLIDVANCLLVFINQEIDSKTLRDAKQMGALVIGNDNKETPSDVKQLVLQLAHTDIQVFYDRLIKACYGIASVPQSSANVTSGGDTGQARLLGQGWSKHYNDIKNDCTYIQKGLRKTLKLMLKICNNLSECRINELYPSDIDIKFNINMTDNMIVKTQSLQTLLDLGFGTETSLNIVELVNDSHAVAIERDANVAEKEAVLLKEQKDDEIVLQDEQDIIGE
jgi:SPP1 family phage portal protein